MAEPITELDQHPPRGHAARAPRERDGEPVTIERAEGAALIDDRGRRYIDGASALSACVHGHRHPATERAIRDQLGRLAGPPAPALAHSGASELATRLVALAPPALTRVAYSGDGAAATRLAVDVALRHWQRRGGQHRRRTACIDLRGGTVGAGGLDGARGPGVIREPDGIHGLGSSLHPPPRADPGELVRLLDLRSEEVAAVIVEPLVRIAGARVDAPGHLRRVRELCDRHGALLVCDESATGLGRTGTMLACEQERVTPDLLCLGGALTGGCVPLGATLAGEHLAEDLDGASGEPAGRAGPLACAAAIATLDAFAEERTLVRLQPKVRRLGELLASVAPMPEVAEVRGRGFIAGIDLGRSGAGGDAGLGRAVVREARARGAIAHADDDVVVLTPPLGIAGEELARLVGIVGEAIAAAARGTYGAPEPEARRRVAEPMPPAPARPAGAVRRAA